MTNFIFKYFKLKILFLWCLVVFNVVIAYYIPLSIEDKVNYSDIIAKVIILSIEPLDTSSHYKFVAKVKVLDEIKGCHEGEIFSLEFDNGDVCPNVTYSLQEKCLIFARKIKNGDYATVDFDSGKYLIENNTVFFWPHSNIPKNKIVYDKSVNWSKWGIPYEIVKSDIKKVMRKQIFRDISDFWNFSVKRLIGLDKPVPYFKTTQKPKVVHSVSPHYPDSLRNEGIRGLVVLKVLIDKSGDVIDTELIKSIKPLDKLAIQAAKEWKFKPAEYDGKKVKCWMTIPFHFTETSRKQENGQKVGFSGK